jgi:Barrel-sandwich domain of CusB or HlyD membrane-fusion
MEPESDHSNSHQPSTASVASDERIHALIAEKEQLAADLPQAKSAIEASVCDVAATERLKRWQIPEREIARLKKSGKVSREIEIDSSVSGVVIERKAFPNMHVEPSTKLYAVADLSTVWVYAEVFQNDIGKVKVGDPASITVDAYPGKTFPARVSLGPVNLHHDRYIANMLRGHTAEDTDSLLRNTQGIGGDSWLWLVREVEGARGERLINEVGKLRHK